MTALDQGPADGSANHIKSFLDPFVKPVRDSPGFLCLLKCHRGLIYVEPENKGFDQGSKCPEVITHSLPTESTVLGAETGKSIVIGL